MKKIISIIWFVALLFVCMGTAEADTIELNLFDLGCAGTYDVNTPPWTLDFDLGVTFSEIINVYIDWSGEITAGLAVYDIDPCNPSPLDVGIRASLGANPWPRLTEVWGGEISYPEPETFDIVSQFSLSQTSSWSDLLDGQGNIRISHISAVGTGTWYYIDYGSVMLNDAILIVEGTIVPEPAAILILGFGVLFLRKKK